MAMTLYAAQAFIEKIVLVLTYFVSVTLLGAFRAWTAQKMGDDTPQELGFLSLNPLDHVSYLWLGVLLVLQTNFAFGRYIPINPFNIRGRFALIRLTIAYLSDAAMGLVISLVSLFTFIAVLKIPPAPLARQMFQQGTTGLLGAIASYFPFQTASSFEVIFALMLLTFVVFNILLSAFNVIVNIFYIIFFSFFSPSTNTVDHINWVMFIVPLIALSFLITPMELVMYKFIFFSTHWLGALIGAF